jgi:hypothetical protein
MTACRSPIRAAVGDAFTDEEIDDIIDRLAARARRLGKSAPDKDQEQILREAAAELTAEDLKEKLIRQRAEVFAARARATRRRQLDAGAPADAGRRLQDFLVGSSRRGAMTGLSVDARGRAHVDGLLGPLVAELKEIEGALPRLSNLFGLADRDFEFDVARELSRLNGADRPKVDDPMATQVAEVLKKAQDRALDGVNARGAWVGKRPGYITRQVHDAIKISGGFWKGSRTAGRFDPDQSKKAQAQWVAAIRPLLDDETFATSDEAGLRAIRERAARIREERPGAMSQKAAEDAAVRSLGFDSEEALLEARRVAMLEQSWTDIVLGKSSGDGLELDDLNGFTPPAGLATKLARRRVLHFKDADSWLQYHQTYGSGSFLETYMGGLNRAGRNMALLEAFGPNPQAAFAAERQRLADMAEAAGATRAVQSVQDTGRDREFAMLDGSGDMPRGGSEARVALIGRAVRIQQALAKLGGMTLSGISDLGASATALNRAGVPLFEAYGQVLKGIGRAQTPGEREAGELVGVTARAIAGDLAGNFAAVDSPVGLLSKAQQVFYRINLFEMWQTGVRRGASTALAGWMGRRAADGWDALDAGMRENLERYGIDQALWDLVRPLARDVEDFRALTPEMLQELDGDKAAAWLGLPQRWNRDAMAAARRKLDAALDGFENRAALPAWSALAKQPGRKIAVEQAGWTKALWAKVRERDGMVDRFTDDTLGEALKISREWSPEQQAQARDEAQLRVQAWFSGFVDDAMTEPRAAEKALTTWGQRDGTALGTIMRMVTQFKSFPLTTLTRNLLPTGRELITSFAAVRAGEADASALGRPVGLLLNTMVGMTVLGYLAGAAKDLLQGKEPLPMVGEQMANTWMRAFIQGGGAGFYGDFLTAQYNRNGQGPLAALAGPSVGTVEQTITMLTKLRDGDDPGGNFIRLVRDNVPFANLFYLRAALNYGLLYQMQEAASPGYMQRMERRMREEEGRGYWLEPAVDAAPAG